jgi:hypothetical protein
MPKMGLKDLRVVPLKAKAEQILKRLSMVKNSVRKISS